MVSAREFSFSIYVDCCCFLVDLWMSLFNIVDTIAELPSSGSVVVVVVVVVVVDGVHCALRLIWF